MSPILLLGANGQVGWELQRALAPLGEVIAMGRHGSAGLTGDLADLPGLEATLAAIRPRVIVNAAAYTAVDKAESEAALAQRINAEAPAVLARAAARSGAWLVHYSTDYVFDGSGSTPWVESDTPAPLSVYGVTKLAGECAIAAAGCRHLIFRTSWVYAARGGNFAKTMVRLAADRDTLRVIADQVGAPTGAELIADVTAHAVQRLGQPASESLSGVYHLAASGETSWYDYARFVLAEAAQYRTLKAGAEAVEPITTAAYPTAARRPLNSRLNTGKLQHAFQLVLPSWQQGVQRMLREFLEQ